MKAATLYSYQNCQTCKKAVKFLERTGLSFQEKPIVEEPPSPKMLAAALKNLDGNIKKLFNTSGQLYRKLELSKKLPSMREEEALQLLSENGMLVKRPFLWMSPSKNACGFNEETWKELTSTGS